MEKSSTSRWLVAAWLVISQTGGALLMFVPVTIIFTIALLAMAGGGMPALFLLGCGSTLLPFAFGLGSWIAFVRRSNKAAAILSAIALLLGLLLYFGMDAFTRYLNL